MTAFARAEVAFGRGQMVVEIRSVNHRNLQTGVHLPRECSTLEPVWRKQVREVCARGKVDVSAPLSERPCRTTPRTPQHGASAPPDQHEPPDLATGGHRPTAGTEHRLEHPTRRAKFHAPRRTKSFDEALEAFIEQRKREGERLDKILREHFELIRQCAAAVRERRPEVRNALRVRWEDKLKELQATMDAHRLEQELAIELVHTDIEEELDRLDSHIVETQKTLDSSGPHGRKLDFLMQEFAREAGTLASKAHDSETNRIAVNMKVIIDQMREQVQNVE